MKRTAIACLAVLVTLLAGQANASSHEVTGELRVLYALVTWGPTPFAAPDAERVAAETADFFHASSAGRLSLKTAVVGPLRLPRRVFDSCDATARRNATPAATFAGYDRIVFVAPFLDTCKFAGEANPTEVLLNGRLFMTLAAHELGPFSGWRASRHLSRGAHRIVVFATDRAGNRGPSASKRVRIG